MIRYDMMPTDQGELLVAIDERGQRPDRGAQRKA